MAMIDTPQDKCEVVVEVLLRPEAVANIAEICPVVDQLTRHMLQTLTPGREVFCGHDKNLRNVHSIHIDDSLDTEVYPDNARIVVKAARLNADSAFIEGTEETLFEETQGGEETAACEVTPLPHVSLVGLWGSLFYDKQADRALPQGHCGAMKEELLAYCRAGLVLSDLGVDTSLVSWNRVLLFHGPPGTGKTSLCKALAQKLSIALSDRYHESSLVEINTHSLFSKWFSESGKLVMKLFKRVREMAEDPARMVVLLIDEVESLAAARKAALSSSEPSDSIRVVNALLTQLDALRKFPNVLTLCTSNITEAIDIAFVDRADCKIFIGNPSLSARHQVLSQSINELIAKNLITGCDNRALSLNDSFDLLKPLLDLLDGCSGRFLRKLPFLALAAMKRPRAGISMAEYVDALHRAATKEIAERAAIELR